MSPELRTNGGPTAGRTRTSVGTWIKGKNSQTSTSRFAPQSRRPHGERGDEPADGSFETLVERMLVEHTGQPAELALA
jgi:hypothetical protein